MKQNKRKLLERVLSIMICITLLFSVVNIPDLLDSNIKGVDTNDTVTMNVVQTPTVEVLMTLGDTYVNTDNFKQDLLNALINKGVDTSSDKIIIKTESSGLPIDVSKFTWNHKWNCSSNLLSNSTYAALSNNQAGTITPDKTGQNVVIKGNWVAEGKQLIYLDPAQNPDIDPNAYTNRISYDYTLEFGDSITNAGVFVDAKIDTANNKLYGYFVSINNTSHNHKGGVYWCSKTVYGCERALATDAKRVYGDNAGGKTGALFYVEWDLINNSTNIPVNDTRQHGHYKLVSAFNLPQSGTMEIQANKKNIDIYLNGSILSSNKVTESNIGIAWGYFSELYQHGCSSIGNFTLKNINLSQTVLMSYESILNSASWESEKNIKLVVNVNDLVDNGLDDASKRAAIAAKTKDIGYICYGSASNKAANQSFIGGLNAGGLWIDSKKGDSTAYANCINQTAEFIKNKIQKQTTSSDTVLIDLPTDIKINPESAKTNTVSTLFPNGKWYLKHDYTYFENNLGQSTLADKYTSDFTATFDKPGKYEVYFADNLVKTIIAHRKPVASFTYKLNSNNTITLTNTSRDMDSNKSNSACNNAIGIASESWRYYDTADNIWHSGKLTNVIDGHNYVIELTVTDYQGASAVTTKAVSKAITAPIADFSYNANIISKYSTLQISDSSYDPAGKTITGWTWSLKKNGAAVGTYTSQTPVINFNTSALGIGVYTYSLVVTNSAGVKSDAYSASFTVIDDENEPEVIITPTSCDWQTTNQSISLTFSDNDSGFSEYRYMFNTTQATPSSSASGWSSWSTKATDTITCSVSQASYLHVQAYDVAGNLMERTVGVYKIDKDNPVISNVTKTIASDYAYMDLAVSASDVPSGILTASGYGMSSDKNSTIVWQTSSTFRVTENDTYHFYVKDKAGNVSTVYNVVVTELVAPYTVVHWISNLGMDRSKHDSVNYTVKQEEEFEGRTNSTVTPNTKTYEGFTSPAKESLVVKSDGTAVLNYYYERNDYKVVLYDRVDNSSGLTLGSHEWLQEFESNASSITKGNGNKPGAYYTDYTYISGSNSSVTVNGATIYRYFKYTPLKPTVNNYNGKYDGQAHSISVTCLEADKIQYSSISGGTYTDTLPRYTDVGTYDVYYKVSGNGYSDVYGKGTVTIEKADGYVNVSSANLTSTFPDAPSTTITDNLSGGKLVLESINGSNETVFSPVISGNVITFNPNNAGTVRYTLTSQETKNYNAASVSIYITVKTGTLSYVVSDYEGVYDAKPHSLDVLSAGSTITYSTNEVGPFTANKPTFTEAGTHTVYINISRAGCQTLTTKGYVTINKAEGSLTLSKTNDNCSTSEIASFSITKNLSGGKISVTTSNSSVATATASDSIILVKAGTAEGIASITVTSAETNNYKAASATYQISVSKSSMTVRTADYEGVYDGREHTAEISCDGASLTYSTELDGTYLTTKPTFTDVGTHKIYFRAVKAGYNTVTGYASVKITKANGELTLASYSGTTKYPDSIYKSIRITNNKSGGTLTVSSSNDSIATATISNMNLIITAKAQGNVSITVTSAETDNYKLSSATYTLSITGNSYNVTYIDVVDSINGTELGRQTAEIPYGTQVRGADLGSLTTDNIYYNGYYYDSDTKDTVLGSAVTVYRIFKQRTLSLPITINWVDNNNKFGTRPSSVTLTLKNNLSNSVIQTITVKGNNSVNTTVNTWGATFSNLQRYDSNGNAIIYTITESTIPTSDTAMQYTTNYANNTKTITNTLNTYSSSDGQSGVTIKGTVTWKDENDKWGFRPDSVEVLLYRNGVYQKKAVVDNDNNYYEFTGLPKIDDDDSSDTYMEAYTYDVVERAISNYKIAYTTFVGVSGSTSGESNNVITKNIANTFNPVDNQTIKTDGRNKLTIAPEVIDTTGTEADIEDYEKLNSIPSEQTAPIVLKQLTLHWNPIDSSQGKYEESYNGYSGIEVNAVITMSETTTIDYILNGKYEICIQNNNDISLNELSKIASNNASFTYENGKYYVTYSYLYEKESVDLNSNWTLKSWKGYSLNDFRFNIISNVKIK